MVNIPRVQKPRVYKPKVQKPKDKMPKMKVNISNKIKRDLNAGDEFLLCVSRRNKDILRVLGICATIVCVPEVALEQFGVAFLEFHQGNFKLVKIVKTIERGVDLEFNDKAFSDSYYMIYTYPEFDPQHLFAVRLILDENTNEFLPYYSAYLTVCCV